MSKAGYPEVHRTVIITELHTSLVSLTIATGDKMAQVKKSYLINKTYRNILDFVSQIRSILLDILETKILKDFKR